MPPSPIGLKPRHPPKITTGDLEAQLGLTTTRTEHPLIEII